MACQLDNGLSVVQGEARGSSATIKNASRRKFGVEKQQGSGGSILSKARAAGVKIPSSSPKSFSK